MRIIIACAGGQQKWDNYLDVPSHLVPLRRPIEEPLLHRTVRQALQYSPKSVWLTAPPGDDRYVFSDRITIAHPQGANEYESTRELWSPTTRTVLLLGDVFFSQEAMKIICGYEDRQYKVFGRFGKSSITGTPYGEIFAASWWPRDHEMLDQHLKVVAKARAAGTCLRPAGWALLRSVQGTGLNRHCVRPRWFQEIDDWTDDIDFKEDYERHPATRVRPGSVSV